VRAFTLGYKSNRYIYYAGSNKTVQVWDRQERKNTLSLPGHSSAITSLALSTDDQRCASASESGQVLVHSMKHATKSVLISPFKQVILKFFMLESKSSPILSL
jgi:WD40 repeat protein